jgi:hypothetical protein
VENRNRPWTDAQVSLKAGNKVTLGIHVSSSLTIWRRMSAPERQHFAPGWNDEASPTGGAVAGMVDVIQICQWADLPRHLQSHQYTQKEYSWHWVFANPRRLREPVQWPGQTSLFKVNVPRRLMPAKSAASIHKVAN